jgi:large-conductance mechanosensitive channel
VLTPWIGRTHERLAVDEVATGASNRSFGLTFAIVFALIGLSPLVRGRPVRGWAFVVAAVVFLAALMFPRGLAPLNRIWLRFGLFLHACISPVILALVFFATVTPIGLVRRALGKDSIRRQADEDAVTYWIERQPPGPEPGTMRRQF